MKRLLTFLVLLPLALTAQRIKHNELDKFTKQPIVIMEPEVLRQGMSTGLSVNLRSEGSKMFILFSGYGPVTATVGIDDEAVLLLSNDSTVTVKSAGLQTFELEKNNRYVYNHQYGITQPQLEMLSRHNLRSIRKYHIKGYADVEIAERNRDKMRRLSALFLNTYVKNKTAFGIQTISLADVAKYVGDSVRACGKIFGGRYLSGNNGKPTLLNMGGAYPAQPLTVVIWGVDRKAFDGQPEDFYKDKKVCAEGRISMYRNKPQMVVSKPAQLQIQDKPMAARSN